MLDPERRPRARTSTVEPCPPRRFWVLGLGIGERGCRGDKGIIQGYVRGPKRILAKNCKIKLKRTWPIQWKLGLYREHMVFSYLEGHWDLVSRQVPLRILGYMARVSEHTV